MIPMPEQLAKRRFFFCFRKTLFTTYTYLIKNRTHDLLASYILSNIQYAVLKQIVKSVLVAMSERDALAPKRPEVAPKSSIPDQAIYYDSSQTPQAVRATDDIKSFFVTHYRTRF